MIHTFIKAYYYYNTYRPHLPSIHTSLQKKNPPSTNPTMASFFCILSPLTYKYLPIPVSQQTKDKGAKLLTIFIIISSSSSKSYGGGVSNGP